MATIPFSCHQQFIWCHVDDKLSFIQDYLSLISTGQQTVVLVKDTTSVRNVVAFLWDCGIPVVYHHSGHLGNQDRLAQVMDSYLSTPRPVIISQESYCYFPFYHTATRVLVVDFPNSIDHYRDYKTLIDFNSHKGLVTALVSQNESYLLPKLKDYILQKGEHPPPWLAQEPVMSERITNHTGGDSSTRDNLSQGNIKSFPSCPLLSNKPEWRNPPPNPPFIGPNILDRPLVTDPKKSWNEVGVSTLHPQSNSYSIWPSQVRVSREVTYRYGPVDIQKGIGLPAQDSHSPTYDSHQYDSLLSKHLSSTRRKSPTKSQSSSISHHNLEDKSQSYASNHPPFIDTDDCWNRRNSLVSKQLGSGLVPPLDPPSLCKPRSSVHPNCGSIPTQSHGSNDLAPRSIISPNPTCPISPRSMAIIPPVAPVAPLVDSNPSSYSNSKDEDIEGDNVDSPFNGDHNGECSSDYSDDGGDLSDESGEYSDSDLSENSNGSDDSSEHSDGDIDSDSFVNSDSTSNASSSKDYSSDLSTSGNLPEVIFTPYECKLFDDSSWCNNASKDHLLKQGQCVLHSNHSSNAEDSPNILRPLHHVPFSTNSNNPGLIYHHNSKDYVGTNDCPSTDYSDQEDFLQLGASNSTTYASIPHPNYLDVDNPVVSLEVLAEPITTASISKAQNNGNNSSENRITKTEDITYPFMPSKGSNYNRENVGSLCGPGVPHADITKHTSCSSLYQPGLVQSNRSSHMGKRIATGLGSHQDTISISDSLAILRSNGGVLHKSYEPSSLDFPNENISHSSAFPKCSHITEQAMSGLTRLPSEDASSPFSLVNIDIPSSEDGIIPIVDIHPAHCSMLSSEHKDSSSSSSSKLSSTQYVPGNAINGNTPGEPLGNVDTLNSQLNHKGLVSMASDQPQ